MAHANIFFWSLSSIEGRSKKEQQIHDGTTIRRGYSSSFSFSSSRKLLLRRILILCVVMASVGLELSIIKSFMTTIFAFNDVTSVLPTKENNNINNNNQDFMIPLERTSLPTIQCIAPLIRINDTIVENKNNKMMSPGCIPRVVLTTSKSRCLTERFSKSLDQWRWPEYEFQLHDDDAVNQLFAKNWSKYFPHLNVALHCLPHEGASSAAKADVWRYLILWDQGGIYTDIDNQPGPLLNNGLDSNNMTKLDGLIAINHKFKPGQSFIAVAPHHPLMFLCVRVATERLLMVQNLTNLSAWQVTGPDVLDFAFGEFSGNKQEKRKIGHYPITESLQTKLQSEFPGEDWMVDRYITLDGSAQDRTNEYVKTSAIGGSNKQLLYNLTGMSIWQKQRGMVHSSDLSCREWLLSKNISVEIPGVK